MAYRGGGGGSGDPGRGGDGGGAGAPPYRPAAGSVWPLPGMTPRPPGPPPQYHQQPGHQPAVVFRAPSAADLAKEVEQKLFMSETALAPPAAVPSAAAAPAGEASVKDLAPVSKKGLAHPARPGFGAAGKEVMIRANHLLVNVADNNLFHYDVSITPQSKSRATNREVLNELIKLHGKTSFCGKLPAYDGRNSLYTAGSLPFESEEFVVKLIDPEKKCKERVESEYKITIRIAGRTDLYHLQQFLLGRHRDMPQETIQVLDVVLRESPSWNYVTVSRSFFSTQFGHRGDIGEGLECWRGYYQCLRLTQMGLSWNIVIQFVEEFLNIRDTSRPLSDRDRVKIKKALRGVRIETNHQEDQIRRYKITGITPIPMSQLIFPADENGTRMTVVQYFWDRYNCRPKYASWPCLQSGSDYSVHLPMEVCKIVEGQRYSKKLNDKQVINILRATCQRPQQREQSIHEMVLHNKYTEDKFAQEFSIKVCNDRVSVPAHVLPPPMLKYHDSGCEKTCAPSVGQWNMINKVVASVDWPEITKYRGLVSAQPHRQEIIEDLFSFGKDPVKVVNGGMIRELLIAFCKKTGRRPERIIFYRDGVSECQFSHVLLHEMDAIRKACASLEEGYLPPVTFVLVQKMHHTRLFPEVHGRRDMTDKSGNILPGTDVDHQIYHPTEFDFYLCSQSGIQGINQPTHYHVLYDENHFTADALQSLTNNLFLSVVPPAYNAHLAAFRACYCTEGDNDEMTNKSENTILGTPETPDQRLQAESTGPLNDCTTESLSDCRTRTSQTKIQVLVKMLDYPTFTVEIELKSSIEELVDLAFHKCGVYLPDIYVSCNGRILTDNSMFESLKSSKVLMCSITPRLRGGCNTMSQQLEYIPLKDHLCAFGDSLFEVVHIQSHLQVPNMPKYFVSLARPGRWPVLQIFHLMGTFHSRGRCLPRFCISDLVYYKDLQCVGFKESVMKRTLGGFRREDYLYNLVDTANVIWYLFRYNPTKVAEKIKGIHEFGLAGKLPILVESLVDDLKNPTAGSGYTDKSRSEYSNHSSLKSTCARIAFYLSLGVHKNFMNADDSRRFFRCMGRLPNNMSWLPIAKLCLVMEDVLQYEFTDAQGQVRTKKYDGQSIGSWVEFAGNFMKHCSHGLCGEKEAEALLCILFWRILVDVQKKLIHDHVPTASEESEISLSVQEILDPR